MVVFHAEEGRSELRKAIQSFIDDGTADEVEALVKGIPELAEAAEHVDWGRAKEYWDGVLMVASKRVEPKRPVRRRRGMLMRQMKTTRVR